MRIRWDMGLGRELGYVFWALTLYEAAYGTWATIWPLWIEHLGAGIGTVGIVLSLGGLLRPFILLGGTWLAERVDTRLLLIIARGMLVCGVVFAAFARSWEYLLLTVVLYGFGELVFPTLHAHIPVHAGDNAARAFSITCTVGPSAALLITPLLASRVIDAFGMQGGLLMSACSVRSLLPEWISAPMKHIGSLVTWARWASWPAMSRLAMSSSSTP
jgi:MFS family permease